MAIQKRKAVATSADRVFKRSRAKASEQEAEPEPEAEQPEQEEEEHGGEEAQEVKEEAIGAARRKELKGTHIDEVKKLATGLGLETKSKTKADLIEAISGHEAAARAAQRAHAARLREVVVRKKEALEALSMPDLRARCGEAGVKGTLTKQARVELLLKSWHEADGVNRGLREMRREERERELLGMDKAALREVCERLGVVPYAREIMAERITRRESEAGRFSRPVLEQETKPETKPDKKAGDLVDTLLASEAARKSELERERKQEEALAKKAKELRATSVEELKRQLSRRGREVAGRKEELMEALCGALREEEAAEARRATLRAMGGEELKAALAGRGLEAGGKKEAMVEALMAHEAKLAAEAQRFEERAGEVLQRKREELEARTAAELKDLCASRGLKVGTGKEERVQRLLEEARAGGEVDRLVAAGLREARRAELVGAEEAELLRLCEVVGADPFVKEIMVERILTHEDE